LNAPVVHPAPGKKYDHFQLSYAEDLLHGKMTVASANQQAAATPAEKPGADANTTR
jgi:hypothetical protein